MTVNFGGNVYDDAGNAVNGASVKLLETGTTTQEGSTVTTDSNGRWDFSEADQDRYDVEITSGSSVRRIKWSDEISLKEIDVRNNTGEGTPAATFSNITSNVDDMEVVHYRALRGTGAADDNMFFRYYMNDDGGNVTEVARMTVNLVDAGAATEDAKIIWSVVSGASMVDALTISSSASAAQSIDFNQDSITFGTGTAATDITLTFDAESADGVITWMEDEDYFKFSDDILMNSTEKLQFGDTGTYVYQSADGQLDVVSDTELGITAPTVDIDASTEVNNSSDLKVGDDLSLTSDSSVFNMGAGNDFTITHDGTTGATLAGTPITVNSTGALTLDSATDITLDADGADVFLKAGGTLFGTLTNSSGELVIKSSSSGTTAATFSGANVTLAGTVGSGAITSSGIIKTDDTTEATSTTDGSLQTDGGLSVAKDAVFGDDVFLLSDSAVLNLGAGNDATLTHDGTTGLTVAANPIIVDSGAQIELDSATGILTFEDSGTEVLRFTEGNSGDVTVKLVTNGKDLIFTDNGDATNMKILDAAAGINVPGEVQTTGIGYTDGDNAMTIADGGGVTFPVSIDVTGSTGIILENDETITNSTNGEVAINGTVVIGTGSATGTLKSSGNYDVTIQTGNSTTGNITITDGANGDIGIDPNGTGAVDIGGDLLVANGKGAVIGHNAFQTAGGGTTSELQVLGTAAYEASILLGNFQDSANGATVIGLASESGTVGGHTVVTDGDSALSLRAAVDDGVTYNVIIGRIQFEVDGGSPAEEDVQGRIIFKTNAGAASDTERFRIATAGQFGIGGANYGSDGQVFTSTGTSTAPAWEAASSRREDKDIIGLASPDEALQAILNSKAYNFRYKDKKGTGDTSTNYVGLMADEAPWAMHYNGTIVNPVNTLGYTVLAFQEMERQVEDLKERLAAIGG